MVSSRKKVFINPHNLHIFKMAANETINVLFVVDFIPYKCISYK